MIRQSYQVVPWTKSVHPVQMLSPTPMSLPNLLFTNLAASAVATKLLLPIKKKKQYEQLNGDTSEIRLTALHVLIGGAGQHFHVVGLRGSDGERSQCDGDKDGELGEHHLDCKKLE